MANPIEVSVEVAEQRSEAAAGSFGNVPSKWSAWNAQAKYSVLRSVSHNGSSYVCIRACSGVDPEQDVQAGDGVTGAHWLLTAKRGKSAYEAAVSSGYEGTEEEYYEEVAQVPVHVANSERYAQQAKISASNAETAERAAQNFALIAENNAVIAGTMEQQAAQSAAAANTAKSDAEKAASAAETAVLHEPIIQNGTWWVWNKNTGSYNDTGNPSQGAPTPPPYINEDTGYWMMWDGEKYVSTPFHSSGVYVGEGEIPAGCNVQIDPNGSGLAGFPCAAEIVDELPTPEARLRGKVILVHTNGEDKAYICVLKGDSYHWIGFLGWSGGEAEGSAAVLGVAILGKMVLGRKEVLGKLDAPAITLVVEETLDKLDAPTITLVLDKLDAPVIRLESDDITEDNTPKLGAPVIRLEIKTEKLNTPAVHLEDVLEKLLTPVIELKEV